MINELKKNLFIRNAFYLYNFILTFISKTNFKNDNIRKNLIIKKYAQLCNANILIETGSYLGDTIAKNKDLFKEIFSIEIFEESYKFCKKRFKNNSNIHLHFGDSIEMLPSILSSLDSTSNKILFWLDSHYDGGMTGGSNNPILNELRIIKKFNFNNSVILIDDFDDFGVKKSYPTKEILKETVTNLFPKKKIIVENTIFIAM